MAKSTSPCVTIAGRKIGPEHPPYIIAEIAGNHLRSRERARIIYQEAKRSGADAIKLETYLPESLAIEIEPSRINSKPQWKEAWGWNTGDIFNLYKQLYGPQDDFLDYLFELGKEIGITVFSSTFSVQDVQILEERFAPPAYKVGALEMDFFPMLDAIAQTGKPILINTAVSTEEKINATLVFLKKAKSGLVILMSGAKVYHADCAKTFGVGRVEALNERYGREHVIGLSEHFRLGNYDGTFYFGHEFSTSCVLHHQVSIIEKHFCGCRSGLPGKALDKNGNPDWSRSDIDGMASLVTEEFQALVAFTKLAHEKRMGQKISSSAQADLDLIDRKAAYGYGNKALGPSQVEIETNEAGATRFIYAVRDLPKNHTITLDDLHFSRAIHHANPSWSKNTPLPTSTVAQVLGAKTKNPIEKGDPIFAESLSCKVDLKKAYEPGLFQLRSMASV